MKIRILCIGKIKDKNVSLICDSYIKKISHFIPIETIELQETNFSSENEENIKKILILEEKEFMKYINNCYNISLCIEGDLFDSCSFSNEIKNAMTNFSSKKYINFIIGGTHGISEKIKNISNRKISFSRMTFNHQIFRAILLEQIYRSFTIINNINYHK